mmetsp:Transcript_10223/g.24569  ORF Transcript_10223/g.24569 Transcript_10223/m.24569 type:complete len:1147 (-) Transcript_10223:95-3535(-)
MMSDVKVDLEEGRRSHNVVVTEVPAIERLTLDKNELYHQEETTEADSPKRMILVSSTKTVSTHLAMSAMNLSKSDDDDMQPSKPASLSPPSSSHPIDSDQEQDEDEDDHDDNTSRNSKSSVSSKAWRSWKVHPRHPDNTRNNTPAAARGKNRISTLWLARLIFILFLVLVAGCMGYAAYTFQRNSEVELATSTLDAIVSRAIGAARDITHRKLLGAITLKSLYSHKFPSGDEWPYVDLNGFTEISSNMIQLSKGRGIAFSPVVQPSEIADFERWAYNTVIPGGEGLSAFGRGTFAFGDPYGNATDGRYHDTTGEVTYDSPFPNFVAPIIQLYNPDPTVQPLYMLNYHSIEARGTVMDACLKCAEDRKQKRVQKNKTSEEIDQRDSGAYCGTLTDITPPLSQKEPGAVIMLPIFPGNTPRDEIVGFLGSSLTWSEILEEAFNTRVSGIDAILRTSASPDVAYTYRVTNGKPLYYGEEGDFHDPAYDSYKRATVLTDVLKFGPGEGDSAIEDYGDGDYFSDESPEYYLTIYPTDDFFVVFSTKNPRLAMIGAVLCIVVTSLLFFGYDALVTKEMRKNHEIIDGRRRFMRFVSHEVRTPLNSVFMGLKLLRDELTRLFRDGEIDKLDCSSRLSTLLSDERIHALVNQDSNSEYDENQASEAARKDYPLNVRATTGQAQDMMVLTCQILQSATSAIDILNDLLNYDKIETGRLQLEREVVDIRQIIDSVMSEFNLAYKAKDITLRRMVDLSITSGGFFKGGDGKLQSVGDPMKLTLVFRNLLSNALKFTPRGGIVSVELSGTQTGNQLLAPTEHVKLRKSDGTEEEVSVKRTGTFTATVSDTGVGMSGEQLKALFKAGVQHNSNQMQGGGGSGLGLYIAKGVVKCHGGELAVQSDGIGKGSTFTVKLPIFNVPNDGQSSQQRPTQNGSATRSPVRVDGTDRTNAEDSHSHSVESEADLEKGESPQFQQQQEHQVVPRCLRRNLKILVVDDCKMNRKFLTRLLEREGYTCDQAEDGLVALDKVKQSLITGSSTPQISSSKETYDSILLDYEMPNLNGPFAAQRMRQLPGFSSYIVGITGNVFPEDISHFKKCGADEVLPKPLNISTLKQLWTSKPDLLQPLVVTTSKTTTANNNSEMKKELDTQSSFPSAA